MCIHKALRDIEWIAQFCPEEGFAIRQWFNLDGRDRYQFDLSGDDLLPKRLDRCGDVMVLQGGNDD